MNGLDKPHAGVGGRETARRSLCGCTLRRRTRHRPSRSQVDADSRARHVGARDRGRRMTSQSNCGVVGIRSRHVGSHATMECNPAQLSIGSGPQRAKRRDRGGTKVRRVVLFSACSHRVLADRLGYRDLSRVELVGRAPDRACQQQHTSRHLLRRKLVLRRHWMETGSGIERARPSVDRTLERIIVDPHAIAGRQWGQRAARSSQLHESDLLHAGGQYVEIGKQQLAHGTMEWQSMEDRAKCRRRSVRCVHLVYRVLVLRRGRNQRDRIRTYR